MTGVSSYGDVTGEYLALRREAALAPSTHELIWIRGPDTVGFLDGLLSQDIASIESGATARSLLLSPQGKLRATLTVLRAGSDVGLVADRGIGAEVIADLSRFKIRVDASIDDSPTPLDSMIGPGAAAALEELTRVPAPGSWSDDDVLVIAAPFSRAALPRYLVDRSLGERLSDAGVARAGSQASTAVRIEAGEPVMGVDIDERTIPQEAGVVEGAVSFTKGCYLGQELVARIDSRGHVNRHLRAVTITANVLPPPGAEIVAGDKPVGTITSIGESLDLRAPVALALVRREVAPGDEVTLRWDGGETAAIVQELPLLA